MNQITYTLCEEQNEDNATSYGIIALKKITEIKGITPDKEKLTKLINLCNQLELDPIHLKDVVCDFLFELEPN